MRVIVCGSRSWLLDGPIWSRIADLPKGSVVIHGDAPGVDTHAKQAAIFFGHQVQAFPADWKTHGRRAGPLRNQRMLDEGKPELVIAFHRDPSLGLGTADMVRRARRAKVPVEIHVPAPSEGERREG